VNYPSRTRAISRQETVLRKALNRRPADWLDGQDRHKLLAAWLRGEGCAGLVHHRLPAQGQPTWLMFLVEISEAPNASSLVPFTPVPGPLPGSCLVGGVDGLPGPGRTPDLLQPMKDPLAVITIAPMPAT
jgi:hypothetical protein